MSDALVPPDFGRCQTERPSTWPDMPSFMTLGPVTWRRCDNTPKWIGTDTETGGTMTLCDECQEVMDGLFGQGRIKIAALAVADARRTEEEG